MKPEIESLVMSYLEGGLPEAEAARLAEHLESSPGDLAEFVSLAQQDRALERLFALPRSPDRLPSAVTGELSAAKGREQFARHVVARLSHRSRRRSSAPSPAGWAAGLVAAAVLAGILLAVLASNRRAELPSPPTVAEREAPVLPPPEPPPRAESPKPVPPPAPIPVPAPLPPAPPTAVPDHPPPAPPEPPSVPARETRPAPALPRAEVAFALTSGALASQAEGKWVPLKEARVPEGTPLRAEQKSRVEFARARVTLDRASRFSLAKTDLALAEGTLSALVPTGSDFGLVLGETRIAQISVGHLLLCARPDRVVIEEGVARAGLETLLEGVEYRLEGGRLLPAKTRTLPAADRPRETLSWRIELDKPGVLKPRLEQGEWARLPQGPALRSTPLAAGEYYSGGIAYWAGSEDVIAFTVRRTTALRFRYLVREPAPVRFMIKNLTKQENFTFDFEAVPGRWSTVTAPVLEIPVVTEGKQVTCEVGDRYGRFSWLVGVPGKPAEILVDDFRVVEIEP